MSIAFRKVWRDLWHNKGRTLLVTLSIAVGVLALGMTTASDTLLRGEILRSRAARGIPNLRLTLLRPASDEVVEAIADLPQVAEAEGRLQATLRWKPTLNEPWRDGLVTALPDYTQQRFDRIELVTGAWPEEGEIAVEQTHQAAYGVPPLGGTLYVSANGRAAPLRVVALIHDPGQLAAQFNSFNRPSLYIHRDTALRLLGTRDYSLLRLSVFDARPDALRAAALVVEDKLERLGTEVSASALSLDIADPTGDQVQTFVNGLSLVLIVMAGMSLGLSVMLVINTINAIIAQQVTQIGIMKIIGGEYGQIVTLYLAGVLVYGLLSLVIAVPVAAVGGYGLAAFWLSAFNVPLAPFTVLPQMLALQLAVGLLTPLLAALWPVVYGISIPVRAALAAYGLGTGRYGSGALDQFFGRVRGLPRMITLSLRNTFRRAGRVALTQLTLVGAGAVFMMVVATSDSFSESIDRIWAGWGFDVLFLFDGYQRIGEMEAVMAAQPGVERVELWTWATLTAHRPGATLSADEHSVQVRGLPDDTRMFNPALTAGRALLPEDGRALVLNQKLLADMGLRVGDAVMLDYGGGRETAWTVVGAVFDIGVGGQQDTAFARRAVLNADLHQPGRATVAQVMTREDTRAEQDRLKRAMQIYFEQQGIGLTLAVGQMENRELAGALFGLITSLLQLMTFLMAVVGSIGLSGTLSINVIERRREIGVMRAVGASSGDVAFIFAGEGLLLGLLSWIIAVPLGLFSAQFFVDALGRAIGFPFFYRPSFTGALAWLVIIVVLSLLASWLPARRATQISVRESLAYE